MERYDAVVVGAGGGVGSAALYHLALRGARVLGLDRFTPGHDRGSSHGLTRIIRLVYMEDPRYVPLLRRAFELWRELEDESGVELYRETGMVYFGPPEGWVMRGLLASASEHELVVERLTPSEAMTRWPGLRVSDEMAVLFDPRAGVLAVEEATRVAAEHAVRHGAELRCGVTVEGWRVDGDEVLVETDRGTVRAGRLVLVPGPWARDLLGPLGAPLEVQRKPLFWFGADERYHVDRGFPVFFAETASGAYYGFPVEGPQGIKVAEHKLYGSAWTAGGEVVTDPLAVDRGQHPEELARMRGFLRAHLPQVDADALQGHAVCMYTMTPDEHFVLDRHPDHPQVCFAAGLSGHGFKFAGALGESLAELALDGHTSLSTEFLQLARFQEGPA
jgi:sarcosine oxidase